MPGVNSQISARGRRSSESRARTPEPRTPFHPARSRRSRPSGRRDQRQHPVGRLRLRRCAVGPHRLELDEGHIGHHAPQVRPCARRQCHHDHRRRCRPPTCRPWAGRSGSPASGGRSGSAAWRPTCRPARTRSAAPRNRPAPCPTWTGRSRSSGRSRSTVHGPIPVAPTPPPRRPSPARPSGPPAPRPCGRQFPLLVGRTCRPPPPPRPVTASRTSTSVTSASACRPASASTMAALVRGTPSASNPRRSGATRSIMAFSSAVPVMAEGLVRGMDILRSGRGAVCSTRPCAKGGAPWSCPSA